MYRFTIYDSQFLPHTGCDVDLFLNKGEILTLKGENGIGKTTLVRRFYEKNLSDITLVEQGPLDYFYDRTLARLKIIYLSSAGVSRELFFRYWVMFNLDKKEDRYQSSLSGGESQALKLALGLSVVRDVLMLDEPSQYLDSGSKIKLNSILHELILEGKSILLVEHDLSWMSVPSTTIHLEVRDGILKAGL